MSTKQKSKKVTLKKSDIDFYKMSGVFGIACVFIVLTLKMQSTMIYPMASGKNLTANIFSLFQSPVFLGVCAILAMTVLCWFFLSRTRKIKESQRIFSSYDALFLTLYLAVFYVCFGLKSGSTQHTFFLSFTIIASLLFYIFKLYRFDFFFFSLMNALFAVAIHFFADLVSTPAQIGVKIALILLGAATSIIVIAKTKAKIKTSKNSFLFFPVFISLVFFAAFMFWKMFTINTDLFLTRKAMLVIMLIQYLIAAIVYTIRLIRE